VIELDHTGVVVSRVERGRELDLATVDELLSTTRAVRKRLDLTRPVEREVILECLQLAMQAPTASNDQNWRWLVVTDADKRAAIADVYRSCAGDYMVRAAEQASDPQTRRVYQSADALTGILADVPVHVIPCIERRIDGTPLPIAAAAWASIIPAAWSFQLALRSRGLGSVYTTLHLVKEREVADLLGIPDTVTQAALLPVAYTIGTDFKPAKRPPAETVTSWNTWGQR
jgi:nitroreductase